MVSIGISVSGILTGIAKLLPTVFKNAVVPVAKKGLSTGVAGTKGGLIGFAKSGAFPLKAIAGVTSVAGNALWAIGNLLLFTLVPLICLAFVRFTTECFAGINIFLRKITGVVQAKVTDPWEKKIVDVAVRLIPEIIVLFYKHILRPVITNILSIACFLFIGLFFVYVFERHLSQSIGLVSEMSDTGISIYNFVGFVSQVVFDLFELLLPVSNMITRFNILVLVHLYEGLESTVQSLRAKFGNGRRLDALGAESFFEDLQPIFLIGQLCYNVYLLITTTVIDLFFALNLLDVIFLLGDLITLIVTKLMCTIVGRYCVLLEFIDFTVMDIVVGVFLNGFLGIFGVSIPISHDISCQAGILVSFGVPKECRGSIFGPGLYRNAPDGPRRLIECQEHSGAYHELLDGEVAHSSSDISEACPHIRQAFNHRGNALNMQKLDTHGCYDMCVKNVRIESCQGNKQTITGTCGHFSHNLTASDARRRLSSFLKYEPEMQAAADVLFHEDSFASRAEIVSEMRARVGELQFTTSHGQCDLRSSPNNIFETVYDGMCVLSTFSIDTDHHRRLVEEHETKNRAPISVDKMLSELHHGYRILNAPTANHTLTAQSSPLLHLRAFLDTYEYKNKCIGKFACAHHGKCVANISECAPAKPPREKRRRRMLSPDCEGQQLCPNEHQCVDNLEDCTADQAMSLFAWVRHYEIILRKLLADFDLGDIIYDEIQCWRYIKNNPEADRYSSSNLGTPLEKLYGLKWCLPLFEPYKYTFEPSKYSLRKDIYDTCVAVSGHFNSCVCPMFIELPSVTLPFFSFVSSDAVFILANGAIWLKYVFYVVTVGYPGYVWSSLFPDSLYPRSVTNALSLYSEKIPSEVYVGCMGLHLGSLIGLIVVFAVCVQVFKFARDVFLFVWTGGMTTHEREMEEMREYMGINSLNRIIRSIGRDV